VEHRSRGELVAASVVDHIVPHRGDERLMWSESNWQSLCKPCHDAKTAREDGGFGREPFIA
jgi:5-methylcytosine-specific restriction protein A